MYRLLAPYDVVTRRYLCFCYSALNLLSKSKTKFGGGEHVVWTFFASWILSSPSRESLNHAVSSICFHLSTLFFYTGLASWRLFDLHFTIFESLQVSTEQNAFLYSHKKSYQKFLLSPSPKSIKLVYLGKLEVIQ